MRRASFVPTALVAVALSAGLLSPHVTASADTGYGVDAVSIDPGPLSVSGFGTVIAKVSVTMHDVDKSACVDGAGTHQVVVTVRRTSGHVSDGQGWVALRLDRVSGDDDAGTFGGLWRIGSTRSGTWAVDDVAWCSLDPVEGLVPRHVDPRWSLPIATTTVVGSRAPTISRRLVPAVVPWAGKQWWQLTYRDWRGRPLAGRDVAVASGASCSRTGPTVMRRTNEFGQVSLRLYRFDEWRVSEVCAFLTVPEGAAPALPTTTVLRRDVRIGRLERYARVSVSSSPAPVPSGRSVTITGTVFPRRGAVEAQRRWSDGTWRSGTSPVTVDATGRYTVRLIALRGRWAVRVVAQLPSNGLAATASRVITVTGTWPPGSRS